MKKSLNFAFICTSRALGGLELSTVQFGRWLKRRGHQIFYIVDQKSPLITYLEQEQLPYQTLKKGPKYFDLLGASALARIIKNKPEFNHYITTLSADIDLCALTKSLFNKNFHFYYFQEMQLGVVKKGIFFDWKFSKMTKWFTPLNWLHQQVKERTNIDHDKIILNPLSIEVARFRDLSLTQAQARLKLNLPPERFIFGFIGRIDPGKNPALILEAFESIADQHPEIDLMIMGEKTRHDTRDYAEKLETSISASRFKERIHRRPFSNQVEVAYRAIDCFIMATKAESIGLVTLEAMASSTLVIGANGGGTPELLDNSQAGLLFEPENKLDLSQKMKHAFIDFNQFDTVKKKALERVETLYCSEITCDIFERTIEAQS
jgi:glycosyltransferase involved in cell wall biosynthesis